MECLRTLKRDRRPAWRPPILKEHSPLANSADCGVAAGALPLAGSMANGRGPSTIAADGTASPVVLTGSEPLFLGPELRGGAASPPALDFTPAAPWLSLGLSFTGCSPYCAILDAAVNGTFNLGPWPQNRAFIASLAFRHVSPEAELRVSWTGLLTLTFLFPRAWPSRPLRPISWTPFERVPHCGSVVRPARGRLSDSTLSISGTAP